MSQGEWKEWSNHVLLELKRLDKGQESLHEKIDGNAARFDRIDQSLHRYNDLLDDHIAATKINAAGLNELKVQTESLDLRIVPLENSGTEQKAVKKTLLLQGSILVGISTIFAGIAEFVHYVLKK